MTALKAAKAEGASITAQVTGRPVGLILGLATSLTPFSVRASFRALHGLAVEDKLARLRELATRRAILGEKVSSEMLSVLLRLTHAIATRWIRMSLLGDPPDYEPSQEQSIVAIAARTGKTPEEVVYDYLIGGGMRKLFFPVTNYVTSDLEPVRVMITDPDTVPGLSDGGAHCGLISDASVPNFRDYIRK